MSDILSRFVKTNKMIVNGVEITYDEIRDGEFKKVIKPVMLDGTVHIDDEIADSNEKQYHYYLNGVKVCTDLPDALGNNRHYQELKVFQFTKDDNSVVEVTHFPTWTPDTDTVTVRYASHALTGEMHPMIIKDENRVNRPDVSDHDAILQKNQTKNISIAEVVKLNPLLDTSKIKFSYDKDNKLVLDTSEALNVD